MLYCDRGKKIDQIINYNNSLEINFTGLQPVNRCKLAITYLFENTKGHLPTLTDISTKTNREEEMLIKLKRVHGRRGLANNTSLCDS